MNKPLFTLVLAAASLFTGCTKEHLASPEGGAVAGQFVSATLPMQVADTESAPPSTMAKSASDGFANSSEEFSVSCGDQTANANTSPSTRAIAQELSNVWVLQFDNSGANVSTTHIGTLAANAYLTMPSLQVGTGYTIYVVANGIASGLTTSNPATLSAFETTMLHTEAVTDAAKLPLAGKLTGVSVINLGDGKGRISLPDNRPLSVVLKRIHAEVTLTVDFAVTGYALTGAQLYNVPIGATYGWNSATTTFPDNTVAANFGYTDTNVAGMASLTTTTSGSKTSYKWFIADNRRGEVAGLTAQPDRNSIKAPAYATFARVTLTDSTTNTKNIYYDIYLGSGAVTNFDVKRNMTYTQSAKIKGSADFQEALVYTDDRVRGTGFPVLIYLTDSKADSPFAISPKSTEISGKIWGPQAGVPASHDIFNGKANTDALMATSLTDYLPAKHCREIGANYYLPAQAELMLVWIYNAAIPSTDRPPEFSSWTSTELSSFTMAAYSLYFSNGDVGGDNKNSYKYVRCVREL